MLSVYRRRDFPIVVFLIDDTIYVFNTLNGTWMVIGISVITGYTALMLGTLSTENTLASAGQFQQTVMAYATKTGVTAPKFYTLQETIKTGTAVGNPSDLFFCVEELLFGRDVTIDSLYVSFNAQLAADATIEFWISGQFFAAIQLSHLTYTNINAKPTELQVFPGGAGESTYVFTAHSPQLEIKATDTTGANLFRYVKIMMLGSFDPNQRPT